MIEESPAPSKDVFVVRKSAMAITETATDFSPEYIVAWPPSPRHPVLGCRGSAAIFSGAEVLAEPRY